ncbi:uncharacterized protein N7518_009270 [Penicillium psychrosexuale]|uniref:uncharacterized protein n=1 Tax=Penicillium psychrosexuale TaxID=1002107 RepID=UPI002544E5F0|nr:uncharacterized protein N7518_009270 [Penicillium psychrosexuale]KAJ5783593.1 hypothetical protein N7518_009270 [Penicillium psychrosexuale]
MPSDLRLMDDITPPRSFLNTPLTPPPTEKKKLSGKVLRVLDGDESLRGYVEDKARLRPFLVLYDYLNANSSL